MSKYNSELLENAIFFKALAHPARLTILKYLTETKTCISGDFNFELPISRTTIAQHLNVLKNANILSYHQEGVKTFYCINKSVFNLFKEKSVLFLDDISLPDDFSCKQ